MHLYKPEDLESPQTIPLTEADKPLLQQVLETVESQGLADRALIASDIATQIAKRLEARNLGLGGLVEVQRQARRRLATINLQVDYESEAWKQC